MSGSLKALVKHLLGLPSAGQMEEVGAGAARSGRRTPGPHARLAAPQRSTHEGWRHEAPIMVEGKGSRFCDQRYLKNRLEDGAWDFVDPELKQQLEERRCYLESARRSLFLEWEQAEAKGDRGELNRLEIAKAEIEDDRELRSAATRAAASVHEQLKRGTIEIFSSNDPSLHAPKICKLAAQDWELFLEPEWSGPDLALCWRCAQRPTRKTAAQKRAAIAQSWDRAFARNAGTLSEGVGRSSEPQPPLFLFIRPIPEAPLKKSAAVPAYAAADIERYLKSLVQGPDGTALPDLPRASDLFNDMQAKFPGLSRNRFDDIKDHLGRNGVAFRGSGARSKG